MKENGLHDLFSDGNRGVKGQVRVLEHHGNFLAAEFLHLLFRIF